MLRQPRFHHWPWAMLGIALVLNLMGWAFVYSATLEEGWRPERVAIMQGVWLVLSMTMP